MTVVSNPTREVDSASWSIDTVPVVQIGDDEAGEEYAIGRLAGYMRRSDGSILVGDGIANTVKLYSSAGNFVRSVAGPGDGPGELRVLDQVVPYAGDSVIVVDYEGGRINVFDPQLQFVRSFRISLQDGRRPDYGTSDGLDAVFGDGNLLMYDFRSVCRGRRMEGFCEDSVDLIRTDIGGVPRARYGRFVYSREQHIPVAPGLGTGWTEPHPQAFWRIGGDRMYYADGSRFEIRVFAMDGRLLRIVRAPDDTRQYARDEVWPKQEIDTIPLSPEMRASTRVEMRAKQSAALPKAFPQISDMLIAEDGNIWVREYAPPRTPRPRWLVFDSAGQLIHAVRPRVRLTGYVAPFLRQHPRIGADYILAEKRNTDGIQSVVMYKLNKSAR